MNQPIDYPQLWRDKMTGINKHRYQITNSQTRPYYQARLHSQTRPNDQARTNNQMRPSQRIMNFSHIRPMTPRPRVPMELGVRLPKLHHNLWLSNYYFAKRVRSSDFYQTQGIKLVINLSGFSTHPKGKFGKHVAKAAHTDSHGINHVNLELMDHLGVDKHVFREKMLLGSGLMAEAFARGEGVLVHCSAGVNRSVSVILAWACLYEGFDLEEVLLYIKKRKREKRFPTWESLTNSHFHWLLKRLCYE